MTVDTLAQQIIARGRPLLVAQLNDTDAAAGRAAREAGLPTAHVVPRGRHDAERRRQAGAIEAATDSFREVDVANVRLAKDVALAVSRRRGLPHADRHAAAAPLVLHVGLLYGAAFTGGRPGGAGTLKASACLASPTEAYPRGFEALPRPAGLEAAQAAGDPLFAAENRLFLLDLTPSRCPFAGAALGALIGARAPACILVSGPGQAGLTGVDVGTCAHAALATAFAVAGWPAAAAPAAEPPGAFRPAAQAADVAAFLGAPPDALALRGTRPDRAYFLLRQGDATWFVKVYEPTDDARRACAKEQQMTLWAAERGLGPACREVPAALCAVVTAYLPDGELTRADVQRPPRRQQVAALLRQIHGSAAGPRLLPAPARAPNYGDGAARHLAAIRRDGLRPPLAVNHLERRRAFLEAAIAATRFAPQPSAGDVHHGNLLVDGSRPGGLRFIDWSGAHLDRPAYDVARFCYTARIAAADVADVVAAYNAAPGGGPPLDLHEVRLHVAMINTDYCGYFTTGDSPDAAREVAQRCRDDEAALAELPRA